MAGGAKRSIDQRLAAAMAITSQTRREKMAMSANSGAAPDIGGLPETALNNAICFGYAGAKDWDQKSNRPKSSRGELKGRGLLRLFLFRPPGKRIDGLHVAFVLRRGKR